MTVEVERKFVLSDLPDPEVLGPGERLRQGYLAEEGDVEVRVRTGDGSAVLTVKAGRGGSRTEVEVPVEAGQAEALWPHTAGRRIEKVRHRVPVGAQVAEVDVYGGELAGLVVAEVEFGSEQAGLVVAEVEFGSEQAAAAFEPPRWFGREVTGEQGWSNAALARHGPPGGR